MKKLLIAAVAGVMMASPALAQMGPQPHPGGWDAGAFWRGAPDDPYQRIQFLQDRINRGIADGSLDRHEARRANQQLNGVRNWIRSMHWQDGGRLTPDQRARVQARLDQVSRQIRWMRHDR